MPLVITMSKVISASIPTGGHSCSGCLDSTYFPRQCYASAQRIVASQARNLAAGVTLGTAWHRQPYDYTFFGKQRNGDVRHRRLSRVTYFVTGRSSSVCRCHGSEGASGDSSALNGPEERSGTKGNESANDGSSARSGSAGGVEAEPPVWDLHARHKQLQAVAAKMGVPLRDIMSIASKKLQDYLDSYRNLKAKDKPSELKPAWDWQRWQEFFNEVEEQQNVASALKFQLEDAVENEDFPEAVRLKSAIVAATANDTVAEITLELKKALQEERYQEAAKFRDEGGAGLVGWWVGRAEGSDDPYGRIIHITSAQGRYIAKGYSARQLSTATPGVPLFEVFVRKDGDKGYQQQAIYLQRDGGGGDSAVGASKTLDVDVNIVDMGTQVEEEKDGAAAQEVTEAAENDNVKTGNTDLTDEGLNRILNFLKDRIPDVKLKVFKVTTPNGEDIPKIVEQLLDEVTGHEVKNDTSTQDNDKLNNSDLQTENALAGESSDSIQENRKETPIRLLVGGVIQNLAEDRVPRIPVRVPARIEHKNRDSFLFHIEESGIQQQMAASKEMSPSWKVATIATQASGDLMPPDVAKVFWNVEKVPVKVSKEVGEFLKLAVSQVQKRRGLFKCTSFQRIKIADANSDALSGLYIGAFGPYTSELVQLRRKHGNWQDDDTSSSKETLDFFEYVEAVKLTGDLNVPAGQVTFRAKIGRECRLPHRGIYPEELGVIARYRGQGRLAEPGFRNPLWIDGELVLLDGKIGGHTNGAELGFVYSVPERHFLVLFNRLKLQD